MQKMPAIALVEGRVSNELDFSEVYEMKIGIMKISVVTTGQH